MLQAGRRHRDRPRAHHQSGVRAPRRRRSPSSRARSFAVGDLARAGRPLRRSHGRAASGRAARRRRARRRRARARVRQSGERHDDAAPLRAGACARRTKRRAARSARLGPRPCRRPRDARPDLRPPRRPCTRRGSAPPGARRSRPDSVSRDHGRRLRHAGADSSHSRPLRNRERLSRTRGRSLRRLRTPDQPLVRMVGAGARSTARPPPRRRGRGREARRRDSRRRRAAIRRAAGDADRRRGARRRRPARRGRAAARVGVGFSRPENCSGRVGRVPADARRPPGAARQRSRCLS